MKTTSTLMLAAATAVTFAGCSGMMPGMGSSDKAAVAQLSPTQGNDAKGTATFTPKGDKIRVSGQVSGLKPGAHGFHIHEKGDCSAPDATSAGGHFNPGGKPHGGHEGTNRHAGDLGNIVANDNGIANFDITIPGDVLSFGKGDNSLLGRGLIVHAGADDRTSQPSGDSGARVACGVINMKQAG